MSSSSALTRYASNLPAWEAPTPSQPERSGKHTYQQLTNGSEADDCFTIFREACPSLLCGTPYSPLSARQVCRNYCAATGCLSLALVAGSLATYFVIADVEKPTQDHGFPTLMMGFLPGIDVGAFGVALAGARIIYKTWVAPRQGEGQAILPSS